jgi:hypothetical protein
MKGKLTKVLRGQDINDISCRTTSSDIYVPSSFVDLIKAKMKPGLFANGLLNELETMEGEGDWMVQRRANLREPEAIHRWRTMLEKNGRDTSVVSIHKLSSSPITPKTSNDGIIFDRWIKLLGVPYIPGSKAAVEQSLSRLKDRFGEKYDIYERRAEKVAQRKKKASN